MGQCIPPVPAPEVIFENRAWMAGDKVVLLRVVRCLEYYRTEDGILMVEENLKEVTMYIRFQGSGPFHELAMDVRDVRLEVGRPFEWKTSFMFNEERYSIDADSQTLLLAHEGEKQDMINVYPKALVKEAMTSALKFPKQQQDGRTVKVKSTLTLMRCR